MLSKVNRIDKKTMCSLVKSSKSFTVGCVQLRWFPCSAVWKVGVVISKKVMKNAVDRNRVRRSLYEVARQFMYVSPNGYYIVHIKKEAKHTSLKQVRSDLFLAFVDMK